MTTCTCLEQIIVLWSTLVNVVWCTLYLHTFASSFSFCVILKYSCTYDVLPWSPSSKQRPVCCNYIDRVVPQNMWRFRQQSSLKCCQRHYYIISVFDNSPQNFWCDGVRISGIVLVLMSNNMARDKVLIRVSCVTRGSKFCTIPAFYYMYLVV